MYGSTLYSLGSGIPYTYNGITPTLNVGAHARCYQFVNNFSRIERRIQQQKTIFLICQIIFLAELHRKHLSKFGRTSYINSDQAYQCTCKAWIEVYAQYPQMSVSMDCRYRTKDNIWIERFLKKIKYEYIYIQPEENGAVL